MPLPQTIPEFERLAPSLLPPAVYDALAGGAGDELTLAANSEDWRRIGIRPRVLVDVADRSPATVLLGKPVPHPLVVAPMGFHALVAPEEAEVATAKAAAATGTTLCMSTFSSVSCEDVAAAVPGGRRWFQLYVFKDRGVTRSLVERAVAAGYEALVVTVDVATLGRRERDIRSARAWGATAPPPVLADTAASGLSPAQVVDLLDAALTWADIESFAATSGLPVLVKGVLVAEDARLAVEHGVDGIIVSNHGGRQLDTVPSTAAALPEVVDAVGGRADVLVDGGIRRGTDVLKALALGARGVLVGRQVLWGLAVGGTAGATRVLELLLTELDNAMALAGAATVDALGPSFVRLP